MNEDTLDTSSKRGRPRPLGRQVTTAGPGDQQLLARGPRTSAGKAGSGSKRAFRLARESLPPRAKSNLKRALRAVARSNRKAALRRSPNIRGAGVRGPGRHAQRAIVKARVTPVHAKSPADAIRLHLTYLERDGVDRDGERGRLFNATSERDRPSVDAFAERALACRHQFRFIVSPERGGELDMPRYARDLVSRMEHDLGTALDWVACVHYDTDQPHVHLVVNGRDDRGGDLVMSRDYLGFGLRHRAMELATNELGYRTDLDILRSLDRDVHAERFTALDRRLQAMAERDPDGIIDLRVTPVDSRAAQQRRLYLGRLAHLQRTGLARECARGVWRLVPDALDQLRSATRHRDIQRCVERHVGPGDRAGCVEVIDKAALAAPVSGRVLGRGIANELSGTAYLVVSGTDGKTYYLALSNFAQRHLDRGARTGDLVTLTRVPSRATGYADRNIVALANRHDGRYDPARHLAQLGDGPLPHDATPERYVQAHVRRLDALASRGFVTREPDGGYRIPPDLIERLERDTAPARDSAFVKVDVHGRNLRAQAAARAYTWLDEQLLAGVPQQVRQVALRTRFQDELIDAAERRSKQLAQLGFAQVEGDRIGFDPQLKRKLARMERDVAATPLSRQFGRYVDLDETRRFAGRVAAIEMLSSGPHAVVVGDGRFTLVPAEPGLAKHVGKDISLTLDPARHRNVEPTRVRYRVLDALDLSPSLGR